LVLSACTAVPSSGPVHAGQQQAAVVVPRVGIQARPPVPGSAPNEIVSGFRFANSDTSGALGVAKSYLVDGASWQPAGVTVVADTGAAPTDATAGADSVTVKVVDTQVGQIAADGTYQPTPAGHQIEYDYQLTKDTKENGGWRITNAPPYLVLTVSQIENSYQQGYVYFLRPDEQMLVPVRVFLPVTRDQLADALLTTLLHGPPAWLKQAVTTALPPSSSSATSEPTQVNGVTTVDLPRTVANLPAAQRNAIDAQISYTLSNAATLQQDFGSLRILAGGQPLISSPQLALQSATDWRSFDPDGLRVDFYYSDVDHLTHDHAGRLVAGDTGVLGVTNLLAPVVAPRSASGGNGELIAGVVQESPSTQALYAGPLLAPKKLLTGSAFTTPSWDSLGNLWTVWQPTSSSAPQVRIAPSGTATLPGPVAAPDLAKLVIKELKVSRDGTRVAVLAVSTNVSQVLVGAVANDGTTIERFYPVAPSLTSVTDFAWASSTKLDILGTVPNSNEPGTSSALWGVDIDGWAPDGPTVEPVPTTAVSIAAAPGRPVVVGTSGNQIEESDNGQWQFVANGSAPHYPG
jgi:Lipoprotein LpqB beta-propeller domain/Sporulation and spore germination